MSDIPDLYNNPVLNIAADTIKRKKQALVFVNTKPGAEKCAEDISKKQKVDLPALNELANQILGVLSKPTKQCHRLARCLRKGIAFHHAGLAQKQKNIIEDNFRNGIIKIIACTPTLAMGLDLPAFRSVIRDARRFTRRGLQYIPVLEYMQMAGRAGRPKYDTFGEAILVASTEAEKEELQHRYIEGSPEEIYSKLAVEPVLRTYLLSLIATRFVKTRKQILEFFGDTFWAHQYHDMAGLVIIIDKMLKLLIDFEFIVSSAEEFASANELDDTKYRATKLGQRVAELYLDPLTAHNFINAMKRASQKRLEPFAFLHMVSFTTELRPLLRVKVKEYELIQQEYAKYEDLLYVLEPSAFDSDYDEFMNSVKTALFFYDWIDEHDEEYLLEKYAIRPGEIRVKLDIADWLIYSCVEMGKLMEYRPIVKELNRVRTRLKYGVREELLPLLKLKNIGRVRARAMYRNGIKDIKGVRKAPISTLATVLKSTKIAQGVKEQLGEKVEKVSKRKRKGQKGLI